jgi:hypothetical protein
MRFSDLKGSVKVLLISLLMAFGYGANELIDLSTDGNESLSSEDDSPTLGGGEPSSLESECKVYLCSPKNGSIPPGCVCKDDN